MFTIIAIIMVVFLAGCKKDNIPIVYPTVTSTIPSNEDINISISSNISANFSTQMDPSSITITSFTVKQGDLSLAGEVSYTDSTATFNPTENMLPNTIYTATITTEVKNVEGTTMETNYIWSFTSGAIPDITAPTVTFTDPANNSTGIAINKLISVTYSESMDPASITSLTYTLKQETVTVPGVVTYAGLKATFAPTGNLEYSKDYIGSVTMGTKDLAGNALAAIYSFSFTTVQAPDIIAPVINLTDPQNNDTGVDVNKVVAVTFSEAMTASTINNTTFTLVQGANPVDGIVAYSGTTATFKPANALTAGTSYLATITTGAKDLAGNALAADTVLHFTTGTATSNLAVVDLGTAVNYVILAKTAITNIPTSAVTGDLGLSPAATSAVTGFPLTELTGYATSPQVTGKIYAATMTEPTPTNLTTAIGDMETAYSDAAGRTSPDFTEKGTGNIGGLTLTKGLYKWTSTVTLPTSITISGSANDVWIFQIDGGLTVSPAVNVTLIGGAQAKNIFWQVAGQVTIGTTSQFEGIILSKTGITFQTGASLNGRALAQTAVILDKNAIVQP